MTVVGGVGARDKGPPHGSTAELDKHLQVFVVRYCRSSAHIAHARIAKSAFQVFAAIWWQCIFFSQCGFRFFCLAWTAHTKRTHTHTRARCGFSFVGAGQQTIVRHVCMRWCAAVRCVSTRVCVCDQPRAYWVRSPIRRGSRSGPVRGAAAVAVINGFGFSHAVRRETPLCAYNANVYE